MKCFVCQPSNRKDAIRFRKVGYYQIPGLPICGRCDAQDDDEVLNQHQKQLEKEMKK